MKHAVIVGGGISGLAAAYELDKAGIAYTLIERDSRLGGVILTHKVDGCTLEAGPDSFISQKPAALQLIKELGLEDQVIGSNDHLRITYVRRKGRLVPLPDGMMMMIPTKAWPMAKSPLLSWGTKIRMGLEYFRKPGDFGDRSVSEFIGDHFGQETVDYLAEPLLAGVFGGDPKQLSAVSTLPRFVEMERKYGSLTKAALAAKMPPPKPGATLFRTMKTGLTSLIDALQPRQTVLLGAPVDAVERAGPGFRVRRSGDWIDASHVILTGPSYEAGRLIEPFQPKLGGLLQSTGYSSSATVTLGFKKSGLGGRELKGFGILVPGVERKRMRACTFVANKFSYRVAEGYEVIRCFLGGAADEGILDEGDEQLVEIVCSELRELLSIDAKPAFYRVQRWRKSMAQYTVGHQKRVEEMQSLASAIPGLYLAGNGYQGIGIPDCIELGRLAAKRTAI